MDWEAIGAVGEVLGAFAVVATLLYLALQTRKNAQAIDATASRDAAYHLSEFHRELAREPELLRVTMKALSDEMPTYTAEEWFQLRVFVISLFLLYQTQYIHRGLDIGSVEESDRYSQRHRRRTIDELGPLLAADLRRRAFRNTTG